MPRFALVEITESELRPIKNEIFFIIPLSMKIPTLAFYIKPFMVFMMH